MRVAIQFYGFLRFYEQTLSYWKNIIDKYNADVFIHTWDTIRYKNGNIEKTDVAHIKSLYSPKYIVAEPYEYHHDTFLNKTKWTEEFKYEYLSKHPQHTMFNLINLTPNLSMWYKWSEVSKLRQKYENKNNFVYDCVLNSRTDFAPGIPSREQKFQSNDVWQFTNIEHIVTPPWPNFSSLEWWVDYSIGILDWWAYGPSKDMNAYCSVYENFENIRDFCLSNPDRFIGVNVGDIRSSIIKEAINSHVIPAMNLMMQNIKYVKHDSDFGYLYGR